MAAVRSSPIPAPFIYEAHGQNAKEHHHRPIAVEPEIAQGDGPGKKEAHFKVENDEEDGDEIEAHVELHARIIEGVEAAFVGGKLLRIGSLVSDQERHDQQRKADGERHHDEDHQREVIQQ